MKKNILALAAMALCTAASAQSSLTLYGVIDTAIRYTSNQLTSSGALGSQTAMTEGAFQGARLGVKGGEDVGGGNAVVFQLENGFQSDNGAPDQQGQLFGRQAFLGLRSKDWGELDVGRQYGIAADVLGGYDPLGTGNFNENEWSVFLYGIRFDNTLKYTKSVGPLSVELQYSLGEQAGKGGVGVTSGAALSYANGPFSVGAVLQQSKDANSARMKLAGAGGSWVAGPAKLYLQYFEARRDPGFAKAASNSGGALANTSMIGNAGNALSRTDRVWTAGALWQAAEAVEVTVGYMNDAIKNVASSGRTGRIATLYALADYHLSKRTDVYAGLDRTTLGGAEIDDLNGVMPFAGASLGAGGAHSASSRKGAAIGLRHKF